MASSCAGCEPCRSWGASAPPRPRTSSRRSPAVPPRPGSPARPKPRWRAWVDGAGRMELRAHSPVTDSRGDVMRYLVTVKVKPGKEADLLRAIEDGTLGEGSVAGEEYLR